MRVSTYLVDSGVNSGRAVRFNNVAAHVRVVTRARVSSKASQYSRQSDDSSRSRERKIYRRTRGLGRKNVVINGANSDGTRVVCRSGAVDDDSAVDGGVACNQETN